MSNPGSGRKTGFEKNGGGETPALIALHRFQFKGWFCWSWRAGHGKYCWRL